MASQCLYPEVLYLVDLTRSRREKQMERTRDERNKVITLREQRRPPGMPPLSCVEIGSQLDILPETASRIYKRYLETGTPSNKRRTGRPQLFKADQKVII